MSNRRHTKRKQDIPKRREVVMGEVRGGGCGRKRAYQTKQDAKRAVAGDKLGLTFHAYLCACGFWHNTTMRQSDRPEQ